jgi:hypothetical protein
MSLPLFLCVCHVFQNKGLRLDKNAMNVILKDLTCQKLSLFLSVASICLTILA